MLEKLFQRYAAAGGSGPWPLAGIVAAVKKHFEKVEHLGDEEGFSLYGVSDRGVNFVVAIVRSAPERVSEVAFLARFVGFPVDAVAVEAMNRNLHLSVASLEEGGDLYLLAGVEAAGAFSEAGFTEVLAAWRRDLMIVLAALSGRGSVAAAFPAARLETAKRFAENRNPGGAEAATGDLLKAYLASGPSFAVCGDCGGRGRRGLVAKTCAPCAGSGFVGRGVSR